MLDFAALNPARKADRAKAADALRVIAHQFGFSTSAQPNSHDVVVRLSHPCGACASMLIEKSSIWVEVVAWHTEPGSTWTYPDSFGDVNPWHHKKATKVYPWATLPAHVQRDCQKIASTFNQTLPLSEFP